MSGTLTGSDKPTELEALNEGEFLWSPTGQLNQPGLVSSLITFSLGKPVRFPTVVQGVGLTLETIPVQPSLMLVQRPKKKELSRASNACRVLSPNHFSV